MHGATSGRTDREAGAGRRAALRGPSLCHAVQEEASEIRGRPPRPQLAQGNPRHGLTLAVAAVAAVAALHVPRGHTVACCRLHGASARTRHVRRRLWERTGTPSVGGRGSLGWGGAWDGVESSGSTPVMASRSPLHAQAIMACAGGPEGPREVAREACGCESSRDP